MMRQLGPAIAAVLLLSSTVPVSPSQIWLAGVDPYVRNTLDPQSVSDYERLFDSTDSWKNAAARLATFKTSTQWIIHAPEASLSRMVSTLRERHIALALEGLMLTPRAACGSGVEGYAAAGEISAAANRIRVLGGVLDYIAMDEPLYFGHQFQSAKACHSSIADIASDVGEKVRAVREIFPNVEIGDIEPLDVSPERDWIAEIDAWLEAYKAATGSTMEFLVADVSWDRDWRTGLISLSETLREHGVKLGVIYNGDPDDVSDIAWVNHAKQRVRQVEDELGISPDQATFQTWTARPKRILPETDPGALINLVNRYARLRTRISLVAHDDVLAGRLTDERGRGLDGLPIRIRAQQDGRVGLLAPRDVDGTVPANARWALIGLRLDVECECTGGGSVGLGAVTYRDDGGAVASRRLRSNVNEDVAYGPVTQFDARTDRPLSVNSSKFAVSAGKLFHLAAPMRATKDARGSGYLAIIFLDEAGAEIKRMKVPLEQGDIPLKIVMTGSGGEFSASIVTGGSSARTFEAAFDGDDRYRENSAIAEAR